MEHVGRCGQNRAALGVGLDAHPGFSKTKLASTLSA
jgi:hypothetical protein